jgi:hypothetical protein
MRRGETTMQQVKQGFLDSFVADLKAERAANS